MKRLTEKQRKNFKTYGILLVVIAFILMYMAFQSYNGYSLKVYFDDEAITDVINFKSITKSSDNGISYIIQGDEENITYQLYTSYGGDLFKYNDFCDLVAEGDSVTIKSFYSSSSNNATVKVISDIEFNGLKYLEEAEVKALYETGMQKTKTTLVTYIVISIVCVVGGIVLLVIRSIDSKKLKNDSQAVIDNYISNSTRTLPSSYLKSSQILNNPKIKVLSDEEFDYNKFGGAKLLKYFKVVNKLENDYERSEDIVNISDKDSQDIANCINEAYGKEKVKASDISAFKNRPTYNKDLWLGLYDEEKLIGVCIGEFDNLIKECTIEYICVLPEYQNRGNGKSLVKSLLCLAKGLAKIVTVFSKTDRTSEKLFESCGFTDNYNWYVLNINEYNNLK